MKELNVKDLEQVTGGDGAFTEIGRAIDNIVGAVWWMVLEPFGIACGTKHQEY